MRHEIMPDGIEPILARSDLLKVAAVLGVYERLAGRPSRQLKACLRKKTFDVIRSDVVPTLRCMVREVIGHHRDHLVRILWLLLFPE